MHLIVGLGNPGERYRHTRHNVGFLVVERLGQQYGISISRRGHESLWGRGKVGKTTVVLAKPQTFMNRSGQAVAALMATFGVDLDSLIVVHDDLDMEFGRIKIVSRRGAGGHRGVQSIHAELDTSGYVRVKVGIGRPGAGESVEQYVLEPWYREQLQGLPQVVDQAAAAVVAVLSDGLERAMTAVNSARPPA